MCTMRLQHMSTTLTDLHLLVRPATKAQSKPTHIVSNAPKPDVACPSDEPSDDLDSGYVSVAVNTPRTTSTSGMIMRDESTPVTPTLQSNPVQPKRLGFPLSTNSALKVYKKDIEEATYERYKDVSERIMGRLCEHIKKTCKGYQPTSMRLVVLGTTEVDAKPRLVVLCQKKSYRIVTKFFDLPEIKQIYQPNDNILQPFEVVIIPRPPQLKTTSPEIDVYIGHESPDTPLLTLCGSVIKIQIGDKSRVTTLGGLIKATEVDGSSSVYGMIAGHSIEELFTTGSESGKSGNESDETYDNEPDDDVTNQCTQLVNHPAWTFNDAGSDLSVTRTQSYDLDSHTWSRIGGIALIEGSELSSPFDWGLVKIDAKDFIKGNLIVHRIDEVKLHKGDLIMPPMPGNIPETRKAIMISGIQGAKRGVFSSRLSYAILSRAGGFIGTHMFSMDDNSGAFNF